MIDEALSKENPLFQSKMQTYYLKYVKIFISTVPISTIQPLLLKIGEGYTFGEKTIANIALYDSPECAEEVEISIAQFVLASYPWIGELKLYKRLDEALKDSDFAIIIPRLSNDKISVDQVIKEQFNFLSTMAVGIDKYAKLTVKSIIIGKYPSLYCHIMSTFINEIPWNQITGLIRNVEWKATSLIADYIKVSPSQIKGVTIFGENVIDVYMAYVNTEKEIFQMYDLDDLKKANNATYEIASFKKGEIPNPLALDEQKLTKFYDNVRNIDHSKCTKCQNVKECIRIHKLAVQHENKIKEQQKKEKEKLKLQKLSLEENSEVEEYEFKHVDIISLKSENHFEYDRTLYRGSRDYAGTTDFKASITYAEADRSEDTEISYKRRSASGTPSASTTFVQPVDVQLHCSHDIVQDPFSPREIYKLGIPPPDNINSKDYKIDKTSPVNKKDMLNYMLDKKKRNRLKENFCYEDCHLKNIILVSAAVDNIKWLYDTLPKMVEKVYAKNGYATATSLSEQLKLLHEGTEKPFSIMTCSMGAFGFPTRMFLSAPAKIKVDSKEIVFWQDYVMDKRTRINLMKHIIYLKSLYNKFQNYFLLGHPLPIVDPSTKEKDMKEYVPVSQQWLKNMLKSQINMLNEGGESNV